MIYLSGKVHAIDGVGHIISPRSDRPPMWARGAPWAADTGRLTLSNHFRASVGGRPARRAPPERYSDAAYLAWLARRGPARCLFATAPDVLCDHRATLEAAAPMLPKIRALGFPAALVAQNGFDGAPWDDFDVLFLGGDNAFKLSQETAAVVQLARRRGKRVHMGRVNSWERLRYAQSIGCSSCDGTLLAFGPTKHAPAVRRWIEDARHPFLDFYPLD